MTLKSVEGPYSVEEGGEHKAPCPMVDGDGEICTCAPDTTELPYLWIVTATTRPDVALSCMTSWIKTAARPDRLRLVIVWNNSHAATWTTTNVMDVRYFNGLLTNIVCLQRTSEPVGVVPAFRRGVDWVEAVGVETELSHADLVCCFHDDLEICQYGWDTTVRAAFAHNARLTLAGFFGAKGLGRADIYQEGVPYDPYQLVREDCYSNLVDGEAHGRVVEWPVKCAVLDGFSAIMPIERALHAWHWLDGYLEIIHHAYDAALGAWTALQGGECWMLPVKCKHYGGRTAVGDPAYQEWARKQGKSDALHWQEAHRKVWEWCKDKKTAEGKPLLPLRVE